MLADAESKDPCSVAASKLQQGISTTKTKTDQNSSLLIRFHPCKSVADFLGPARRSHLVADITMAVILSEVSA
jgi:hypothetical protein